MSTHKPRRARANWPVRRRTRETKKKGRLREATTKSAIFLPISQGLGDEVELLVEPKDGETHLDGGHARVAHPLPDLRHLHHAVRGIVARPDESHLRMHF